MVDPDFLGSTQSCAYLVTAVVELLAHRELLTFSSLSSPTRIKEPPGPRIASSTLLKTRIHHGELVRVFFTRRIFKALVKFFFHHFKVGLTSYIDPKSNADSGQTNLNEQIRAQNLD